MKSYKIIACPDFSGVQTSYEIIKAQGGKLLVETKEGKGSEFIIKIPIT